MRSFKNSNFALGFLVGIVCFVLISQTLKGERREETASTISARISSQSSELYEHHVADFLFNEVRIFCIVFTHPDNHKTRVVHVRNTWGRRCNKLLFISVQTEPKFPDIVAMPVENGRAHLWHKYRYALKHVHDKYLDDADWFLRTDDDNYILLENLRFYLYQFRTTTSIHIGHRFAVNYENTRDGYMAGGGQVFSKKALVKFATKLYPNKLLCEANDGEADDMIIGRCLWKFAYFIDARDDKNEKLIFPVGIEEHVKNDSSPDYWYQKNLWHNVTKGSLKCCSEYFIGAHYVNYKEMYFLDYVIYRVHPFGLQKGLNENLPRKLSLEEVANISDTKSFSPNFKEHKRIHNLDEDEKYRRRKKK